jgi:hypothetical protein
MSNRIGVVIAALLVVGCGSAPPPSRPPTPLASQPSLASEAATPGATAALGASPSIDPARFTVTIDNPWFPLKPGTVFTYRGTKDGERAVDVFKVTAETIVVDGVTCLVIEDQLTLNGIVEERTRDYYTQDVDGNVWYFGEDTAELDEHGNIVSTEGTWHAGIDGALPGIFMTAQPRVGESYLQEFYRGHAEDHFEVVALAANVKVPFGTFSNALQTKEWTPLEPDVVDNKYYVRGLGEVKEVSVKGPLERLELVKVVRP